MGWKIYKSKQKEHLQQRSTLFLVQVQGRIWSRLEGKVSWELKGGGWGGGVRELGVGGLTGTTWKEARAQPGVNFFVKSKNLGSHIDVVLPSPALLVKWAH